MAMFITPEWKINGLRSVYPGEKGLDLSLCWHQPSITAWQIYRCVGGRLADHWEAWSSRDHGTHSLVRSIKHWELLSGLVIGLLELFLTWPTTSCWVLTYNLYTSFLCIAHSTAGVCAFWRLRSTRVFPWCFLQELPVLQASSTGCSKNSSTCDFNLGETQFLLGPLHLLY